MNKTEQNLLMLDVIKIILSTKNRGKFTVINNEFNVLYNKYMDIREEYDIFDEADKITNRNGSIENIDTYGSYSKINFKDDSYISNSIQILSANTNNEIRKGFNNKKRIEKDKFKEIGLLFFKLLKDRKNFDIKFEDIETRDTVQILLDKIKEFDNQKINNIEILNSVSCRIIVHDISKHTANIIQDNKVYKIKPVELLRKEEKYKSPLSDIIKNITNKQVHIKNDNNFTKKHISEEYKNSIKPIIILNTKNSISNKDKKTYTDSDKTSSNLVSSGTIANNIISSYNSLSDNIEIKKMELVIEPSDNIKEIKSPVLENKKIIKSPYSIIIDDIELNILNKNNIVFTDTIKKNEIIKDDVLKEPNNKKNVVFTDILEEKEIFNDNLTGGKKNTKRSVKTIIKNINQLYNTSSATSEFDDEKLNKINALEEEALLYKDNTKCKEYKNIRCKIYNLKKSKKITKYKNQYHKTGGKKQAILDELENII